MSKECGALVPLSLAVLRFSDSIWTVFYVTNIFSHIPFDFFLHTKALSERTNRVVLYYKIQRGFPSTIPCVCMVIMLNTVTARTEFGYYSLCGRVLGK